MKIGNLHNFQNNIPNMDQLDFKLQKLLFYNSRLSFRELSHHTGLSVSTVHKRIHGMLEAGNLQRFTARPHLGAIKGIILIITASISSPDIQHLCDSIGTSPYVHYVGISGGNFLYIGAYLRDISELNSFQENLNRNYPLKDVEIRFMNIPYKPMPSPFTKLDLEILRVLNKDSRISVSDIVDRIGSSAKTVSNRIKRMINEKLVFFSIEMNSNTENDIITIFECRLPQSIDSQEEIKRLNVELGDNILYIVSFSNVSHNLMIYCWSPSLATMREIYKKFESFGYSELTPHILIETHFYPCWRDNFNAE